MNKYFLLLVLVLFVSACVNVQEKSIINEEKDAKKIETNSNEENQQQIIEYTNNNDKNNDIQENNNVQENNQENNIQENRNNEKISLSELSKHNSRNDCWVAYDKKVYDVTQYLGKHPGGVDAILKYCGTADQFQEGFTKKHGTSKNEILFEQTFIGYLE
ncbi:MAG: cytochrome b5-like heme/steroid binding domain-containing protein [Candidatus Woesearchaeota archaeon]